MNLQESGEMYLETILLLSEKLPAVRSVDVSDYMGYSRPSVSRAVGILKKGGYLEMDSDGTLRLTPAGKQEAEKIYSRHRILNEFLTVIGVSKETAEKDACKIEHVISDETYQRVSDFVRSRRA